MRGTACRWAGSVGIVYLNNLILTLGGLGEFHSDYKNGLTDVLHNTALHPIQVKLTGSLRNLLEHQSFEANLINLI